MPGPKKYIVAVLLVAGVVLGNVSLLGAHGGMNPSWSHGHHVNNAYPPATTTVSFTTVITVPKL